MAANSALLAVQYAAGIPAPRRQLRRKLATQKYGSTVIAANPAVQYEAIDLVSAPSRLSRRSVTKRDKIIVAAYPGTAEIPTSGYPEHTDCHLVNESDKELTLDGLDFWLGSKVVDELEKEIISAKGTFDFKHLADTSDSVMGSSGYVAYQIEGNLRWVIAWRNSTNESNKVYTQIIKGRADWDKVKANVNGSRHKSHFEDPNIDYTSEAVIDRTSAKPKLTAKLAVKSKTGGGEAGGGN
ncbi:hypothetical protein DITRI_Ditri09bG0070200 [Diplodiscus trichospermus]